MAEAMQKTRTLSTEEMDAILKALPADDLRSYLDDLHAFGNAAVQHDGERYRYTPISALVFIHG